MKAHVKVVGMVAGGRGHVVAYVRERDPVLLLPEPTNQYDRHAIAVYTMPRATLEDEVLSSLRDPQHVGRIGDADRRIILDRQAGYVPREVAATLSLPPTGIIGYVSAVRYAPPETTYDRNGRERVNLERVAGFDVCAWLERTDPDLDRDLDREPAR
jgi:hypothetical protein